MYKISILLLFLIAPIKIKSQDMTLDSCITYGLNHNLSLKNENIKALIQKESYKQSFRELLPNLYSGVSGNVFFGKSIDPTTNDFINQELFSGDLYIASELVLFNGFVKQNSIAFSRFQYLISLEDRKQMEMELMFDIMNDYYNVLYYEKLLKIAQEQLELTQLNLHKTEKLIELGLKAQSDLLEIKAQELSEKHNITSVENHLESALLNLKNHMNFPLEQNIKLKTDSFSFSEKFYSGDSIFNKAVLHMPMINKMSLGLKVSENNIALSRGLLYPSLSLGAGYSTNYANTTQKNISEDASNPILIKMPLKEQFSNNASQTVYLSLTIPIFYQWDYRSKIKIAKYENEEAENTLTDTKRLLYQQINEDYQSWEAYGKEREQLIAKLKAVEESYTIAEKKLDQGIISVIEFYTVKNQLANTQAELLRTEIQLEIKEKTLEFYIKEQ